VAREVSEADILATSVGQPPLPAILPLIAQGLLQRRVQYGDRPLDIIIAENLHSAAEFFREQLTQHLPEDYPLDSLVGLIETSIGKMVPIMREKDVAQDPLWVFAEPYNELILDKHGFKNPIPPVAGLALKENIKAYVDRKLFIHNLGHAAAVYLGYQYNPRLTYTYEVLEIPEILTRTKRAMMQSARALLSEYPHEFTLAQLEEHVDDLLHRFQNRALGDTVHRVGRDLYRKLSRQDRLIGALLLAKKHRCQSDEIARTVVAAVHFRAADEKDRLFPNDRLFIEKEFPRGLEHILTKISGLNKHDPLEAEIMNEILSMA
jgi:mannitol-1-phosphate 5-dehydrogenase